MESVQESVLGLAGDGAPMIARQQRLAQPMLGGAMRLEDDAYLGAYATGITGAAGIRGRFNLGGITLLAGASYAEDHGGRAALDDAVTLAAAIRYVLPGDSRLRLYTEAGGWSASASRLALSRTYVNGAGTATGVGTPEADLSYIYFRAGLVLRMPHRGELVVAGEIGRSSLDVDAYVEPLSNANPFEAHVAARSERSAMYRARLQYSIEILPAFDVTAYGAAVWAHPDDASLVSATIPGIGRIVARGGNSAWAEFGARLGYRIAPRVTFDAFIDADTGEDGVGDGFHVGLGIRLRL